ncbi:MAG: hypothetical protein ACRCVV_02615, partial [Shewanella sp.]
VSRIPDSIPPYFWTQGLPIKTGTARGWAAGPALSVIGLVWLLNSRWGPADYAKICHKPGAGC